MKCRVVGIMSCFVILVTAAENSSTRKIKPMYPTYEQTSSVVSTIESNGKKIIALNKHKQPPSSEDEFATYWTKIFEASEKALCEGIDMQHFSSDIFYKLVMNIVRREYFMYEDLIKNITKIAGKRYGRTKSGYYGFYDEVIDKLNKVSGELDTCDKKYKLDDAVERQMLIDSFVFLVAECHKDNSHVGLFTEYPDLLDRNIERYMHDKNVTFVYKSIVYNFVNDKGVNANHSVILKKFVEKIYKKLTSLILKHKHNALIGFDKDFVSEYEKVLDSLQTDDGTELTIESLINNETFRSMFPYKFFKNLPVNLEDYSDPKSFLTDLSKCRFKKCFIMYRRHANNFCCPDFRWYRGNPNKFRVKIKDEPLLVYRVQDVDNYTTKYFINYYDKWTGVIHLKTGGKYSDYDIETVSHFFGMKFEYLETDICPISKSVMTRPVCFAGVEKNYDLTSIMLYWIRSVSERDIITYQIYELSSNKTVDIRNFLIVEERLQAMRTFFARAGSFGKHIEDYKFHNSLNAYETNFTEIISTIVSKFPSISEPLKDRIIEKVNEAIRWYSDQNGESGNNNLEFDGIKSHTTQQNQNLECDSVKYKECKIVSIPESPLSNAEKNAETWNKYVDTVREDLQDYRSQL